MKKRFRKFFALYVVIVLLFNLCPVSPSGTVASGSDDTASMEAEASEESVEVMDDDASKKDELSEAKGEAKAADGDAKEASSAADMPAFAGTQSVDGVKVTVFAEEGVFPKGSSLSVSRAYSEDTIDAGYAVDKIRDKKVNVAASYTFDVKVIDKDGNELQPADGKRVNISFKTGKASSNLNADIYHISEENNMLTAEQLKVVEKGDAVTAGTDGFSLYTVEFTYDELQYVMEGDTSVALTDIMDKVGLTGEVTEVEVSDDSLFSAKKNNGRWIVTANKAFSSEEWMKVTIDGIVYEIVVTDDQVGDSDDQVEVGDSDTFQSLVDRGGFGDDGISIKLTNNIELKEPDDEYGFDDECTITGDVTIDLNGYSITGYYDYYFLVVGGAKAGNLILKDSGTGGCIKNINGGCIHVDRLGEMTVENVDIVDSQGAIYNDGVVTLKGDTTIQRHNVKIRKYVTTDACIVNNSTMTIGGNVKITENVSSATCIVNNSTMTIEGNVEITGNDAPNADYIIESNSSAQYEGLFIKDNVEISGNAAKYGAVSGEFVEVSGTPIIAYNECSDTSSSGGPRNSTNTGIVLNQDEYLYVEALDERANITVYCMSPKDIYFCKYYNTSDILSYFTYENNDYKIAQNKNERNRLRLVHTVTLTGGAKSTNSGGATTQDYIEPDTEMETVTYTANTGYWFEEISDTLSKDGITVTRADDGSTITVSGKPTKNVEITIPEAVRKGEPISATATFKVVNGSWSDGTKTDKTVTIEGVEGDDLKLKSEQIPAGLNKPDEGYKEGSWDVEPGVNTTFASGDAKVYTYTYAPKTPVSYTVTFKVVNGSWNDDGTAVDKTVTIEGYLGDELHLTSDQIPSAGEKPDENYKEGSWDVTPTTTANISSDTTYTYTYAEKDRITANVTFKVVNGSWNDGTSDDKVVEVAGYEGSVLKLTSEQIPSAGDKPAAHYKSGTWNTEPSAGTELAAGSNTTYTYTYEEKTSPVITTVPTAKTLTYNGAEQELITAGAAEGGNLFYAVTTDNTAPAESAFKSTVPAKKDAGSYVVWYWAVGDSEHDNADPVSIAVSINKASVTITADDKTSGYGENIVALTYKTGGDYVAGDNLGIKLTTSATEDSDVGVYPITVNWNNNPNYDAAITEGRYTITKGKGSFSVTGYSGTYDGKPHGIEVSENTSLADFAKSIFSAKKPAVIYYAGEALNSGNYKTVGSTTPITYTDAGLYTVYYYVVAENFEIDNVSGSKTVEIKKAPLKITAKDVTITYGDEPKDDGVTKEGFVNGESDSVLEGTLGIDVAYWQYREIGEYAITPYGVSAKNYDITLESGKLTVKPKVLTFKWIGETKYEYDGEVKTVTAEPDTVDGDVLVLTYEDNIKKDADKYVARVTGISGDKAECYELSTSESSASFEWEITPLKMEVSASDVVVDYDGKAHGITVNVTKPESGYKISYGKSQGSYSSKSPTITKAGSMTVYYKVEADNYEDYEGSATVTVNKEDEDKKDKDDKDNKNDKNNSDNSSTNNDSNNEGDNSDKNQNNKDSKKGKTSTDVDIKPGTPNVSVDGLDKEAEAIQQKSGEGKDVKVTMAVEQLNEQASTGNNGIGAIKSIAQGKLLTFFDIKVIKDTDSEESVVTETSNVLRICIPYSHVEEDGLCVYRYHGSMAQTLLESDTMEDGTYQVDRINKNVYIYTSRFSVYAIGYTVKRIINQYGEIVYIVSGNLKCDGLNGVVDATLLKDGVEYKKTTIVVSDGVGAYRFTDLEDGTYSLKLTKPLSGGGFSIYMQMGVLSTHVKSPYQEGMQYETE